MRTGQGAIASGYCGAGGGGAALRAGGAVGIGSAATVLLLVSAAVGTSLNFFFDFAFLGFFWRALTFVAIDFPISRCAMRFNGRRTASLLPIGGGSRTNRAETFGDPVGVNRADLRRGPSRRGKALLPGVVGLKHVVDPFSIGRICKEASRLGDVLSLLIQNPRWSPGSA